MGHYEVVRRLGTEVFEVEGFPVPALYVRDRDWAFVCAGLSPEDQDQVADELLSTVTAAALPQR